MKIFDKITDFYNSKKPFVVYRKPNSNILFGFFTEDDSIVFTENYAESGFVFAPFDASEKAVIFPLEKSKFISEELSLEQKTLDKKVFFIDEESRENHMLLVDKTIDKINKSDLKKVVISRKENVQFSDFDLIEAYQKLLQNYKNAFVYVWFHPKVGLWLGATPETLLDVNNTSFTTMSLAGTQVYKNTKNVVWRSKELEEQQLVTNFIESQLQEISSNLKINKTETVKAGSLLHLRTKVTGKLKENFTLKSLIRALHPTPAVCGLPRNDAKKFILENENYHRSFYTGFLGELNLDSDKKSSLFVNLRCMKIEKKEAAIFVGGGITKDSKSEDEWKETVSKSKTMKRIL